METLFYIASVLLAIVLIVVVGRFIAVWIQRPMYKAYWRKQNSLPPAKDAVRLLVLGDSIMQGIGASKPEKGLAGLLADRLAKRTGRPVAVTNLSVTGARVAAVLNGQLPAADVAAADIIVVSVSANDSVRMTPPEDFKRDITALLAKLSPEKTIVADVLGVGRRHLYQPALEAAANTYGIRRASLVEAFYKLESARGVVAGDFFHPNDRGYEVWFSAFQPEFDRLIDQLKTEKK